MTLTPTKLSKWSLSVLCLTALTLVSTTSLFASTTVDPSRFVFTVKPGAKTTGTIKVTNPGAKEAIVKAVVYDWTLNDADRMVTSEAGSRNDSLKGLIKFNPQNFKLAPGDSQIVRFTLTAPADAALERRGIVFFEEKVPAPDKATGANVLTQVGSTIYLGVEGMKMAFNPEKIAVVSHANTCLGEMTLSNGGVGHIRYQISYKIINEKGSLVNEAQLPERVILPGFKRKVTFPLPENLGSGKYNLLFSLRFLGTDKTVTRTIPFSIDTR